MKKSKKLSASSGFTLVELLISMAVTAVLLGVALVSFQGSRAVARDAQRKAELEEIRSALEVYRIDNGVYPLTAEGLDTLTPDYMGSVPTDPLADSQSYTYRYVSDSLTYALCSHLETRSDLTIACGVGANCCSSPVTCDCYYSVVNP